MYFSEIYLSWIWLPLTTSLAPHYSCTSPMDCISYHSLHSHIPIHHYTNHSLTLIVSPHLHLIHTHTHISSTLPYKHCEVLFLPRLTFLSVTHPTVCYLCVWPRTAQPWNSEPVTPTSAWYCLRLCPASDIPVFARWPLPVWFCLLNISLHLDPSLWLVITILKRTFKYTWLLRKSLIIFEIYLCY